MFNFIGCAIFLTGFTCILRAHTHDNFDLGGDKFKLFVGVFTDLVKRMLAAIADFIFITNIVNDTLTRNVGRYFLTLWLLACIRNRFFFVDVNRLFYQLFSFIKQLALPGYSETYETL